MLAAYGARPALVGAAALTILLALLAMGAALQSGSGAIVTILALGLAAVAAMLLVGLRALRAVKTRASAAFDRAAAAEAIQRARAEELAGVLAASESLMLTGEGQIDYLGVLTAITPDGATSFLVRVEGETDATVVAAHGPLAASVVAFRRPVPSGASDSRLAAGPVTSFRAADRASDPAVTREHMAGLDAEVAAGLAIRLAGHDGRCLGWLHMVDRGEGILEPGFVSLAQLVANQIGVAMENNALLARVRRQLAEGQRVQHQLIQASKLGAVGELAAAVAHEVNNPLTGILGFSELLLAELPEDDSRREEVAVIREEAVRARSIVKALVEFARPRPPQRRETDLNDLARSTLELIGFRASEARVGIAADYGDLPPLQVDPDALGQVLLNLFGNAIDAMPNGGELRVATLCKGDRVAVAVADAGVGMDEVTRGRVFTPFFSTRSGNAGATGLGLSVSLQIVESHGGTIEVESAPGKGSVFTVWLPVSWPAVQGVFTDPGTESSQSVSSDGPDGDFAAAAQSPAVTFDSKSSAAAAGAVGSGREVAA